MRSPAWKLGQVLAPLGLLPLFACLAPPVASPKTTVTQETQMKYNQTPKNKVDILFMVDNSPSMAPMQDALQAKFGSFLQVFADLPATGTFPDMHIGVVTSDFGAGDTVGGGCMTYGGGDGGRLQALGAAHDPSCVAPLGAPFIQYAFDPNGGQAITNLPNGKDVKALTQQFTCMASVGVHGCGFEHQLESVRAALTNNTDNKGFLRDDALLAVVFLTNEDDGSADKNAKFYEQPPGGGADPQGTSMFGQYSTYRQTRFAVECNGMQIPYGVASTMLTGCIPAPNPTGESGLAFDVNRYINFFKQPASAGGVKANPDDVILVGIDGPEEPFQTVLSPPPKNNATTYGSCPPPLSSTCVQWLQHSCQNKADPTFFADPGVRLNAVIKAGATSHKIASICGDDLNQSPDFTKTLKSVGELISSQLGVGCIDAPIADRTPGNADCVVEDVTSDSNGTTIKEVPSCTENGGAKPCWKLNNLLPTYVSQGCTAAGVPRPPTCKLPASCQPVINPANKQLQLVNIIIDRSAPVPGGTIARVSCTTIASSQ